MSGTRRHSTGGIGRLMDEHDGFFDRARSFSIVDKRLVSSKRSPMPAMITTSALVWLAIRIKRRLYGSPATEKMGIFCDLTRQLKTSIIGIFVRTSSRGMIRRIGLKEGWPISTLSPTISGPPSMGSPAPLKRRPNRASLKVACDLPSKKGDFVSRRDPSGIFEDLQGDEIPIEP